jgi:hypothetical protein
MSKRTEFVVPITKRVRLLATVIAICTCSWSAVCASPAQRNALTASRNLADLVDEAGIIVLGRVASTRIEPHPDYPALLTVVVTLQVDETLKGQASDTYTLRQFIWEPLDRADSVGFEKGGRLLLLLLQPNGYGLSSPAGLEQGRFTIRSDNFGRLVAANGRNNAGLFNGVVAQANSKGIRLNPRVTALASAQPAGAVPLDDLRDLIKQLAVAN